MQNKFDEISQKYLPKYIKAGYPPSVCAQLIKSFSVGNNRKTVILDAGCGKGLVG